MKAGIGYFNENDAFLLGRKVAEGAINNGGIDKPDLVIAFCSGLVNHEEFFNRLQKS